MQRSKALDLQCQRQDFAEAVEGVRRGYGDVKAGKTRPAAEVLADLRRKYDIPVKITPNK